MISVGFIQDKYFSIENLFNKFEIERVSPPILVFNNVFFFCDVGWQNEHNKREKKCYDLIHN